MHRRISEDEAAVVQWLLDHPGPKEPTGTWPVSPVDLIVVGGCECGCRSIDFDDDRTGVRVMRDAIAILPDGRQSGLLLWGTGERIQSLEIYDLDLDSSHELPPVSGLRTWEDRDVPNMEIRALQELARNYTAAWCSQRPASVAAFFAAAGSLTINGGDPAVGRAAITEVAQGFMTAFPDLAVRMDGVGVEGTRVVYRWTLTGTNTGPGGTGRAVRISGFEEWTLGAGGLIAESKGHFDEADYDRQLNGPA